MAWPVVIPTVDAEPIAAGVTDTDLWDLLVQFPYAIRERVRAGRNERWFPAVARVWYQGTITAFADNGDGTCTATVADTFCTDGIAPDPWFTPCVDTANPDAPLAYEAAVDDDDATKAVGNCAIISNTAHTVTFQLRATNLVTSKQWTAVSDAVGRLLVITRSGEPWWNHTDRFLPWPNAPTYFAGTVLSNTATTLRVDNTTFSKDQWNGYEIMVMDAAGVLHRLTITATATDTTGTNPVGVLTFASIGSAVLTSQPFAIIKAGGRFMPGRPKPYPFEWYTGLLNSGLASHKYDDTIDGAPGVPTVFTVPYDHDESGLSDCVTTVTPDVLLDSDPKTPEQAKCVTPDHFENPTVTRTFRFYQNYLEGLCPLYLPQATPQGSSKTTAFNGYGPGSYFAAFGCDSATATVASGSFTVDVSTWEPRDSYAITYTIKAADGGAIAEGTATITSGGSWQVTGLSGRDGCHVVASPGWHRYFEKMIGRAYGAKVWKPDADPDNPGSYFTTPQEPRVGETEGPGTWVDRPAYTHYAVNSDNGLRGESSDSHDLFANGDLARYVADNFWDTSTGFSADDPRAPFYDRGFEGLRKPANQSRRVAALSGTVDAANVTTRRLVDSTKDWFNFDFYGDAVIKTWTGTQSLSGTSATLSTVAGSAFFTAPSQWVVGQTIEGKIGVDANGNDIWDAHLITAQTNNVVTWTGTMPAATAWRIVAVSPPNALAGGRKVKLTALASDGTAIGSPQTVVLDGNGRTALYFPTITIPANVVRWTYEIQEMKPSAVYERTAGAWVLKTSGTDTVRRGVTTPVDFIKNPYGNLPHIAKGYGRVRPHDLMVPVMEQVYAAINKLTYRAFANDWTAHPNPTDPAINNSVSWGTGSAFLAAGVDCSTPTHTIECDTGATYTATGFGSDMESGAEAHPTATSVEGAAPRSSAAITIGDSACSAAASAVASYALVTGVPGYGLVPNPGIVEWLHATLDGTANCSYAGNCSPAAIPDTFTANVTAVACNDWTNVAAFTIYSNGDAYSGLVGSTAHGEWPNAIVCASTNPCSPSNPTGTPPDGGGSGGWETDGNKAVASYSFVYSA